VSCLGTNSQTPVRRGFEFHLGHLGLLRIVLFELAFFLAYKYAMSLAPRNGAPFWMPDSVLLCALLLSRPKNWWIYLVAPLPVRLLVAVPPSTPMWFLAAAFLNDSLKALVAAALLRRVLPGRGMRFHCLRDLWLYLAAAVVAAPALSGIAGAASWIALGREFWPTWCNWFLGDALANIVLTPLLISLAVDWRKLIAAKPLRYLEGVIVFSGLILAIQVANQQGLGNYIPVAFLLLAAIRFGPAGASGALTIMSILMVVETSASRVVASVPPAMDGVLSMQLFLIVIGVPILSLSVLMEQQRRTEQSLRESEARFRNMADTAPVMIWISGPDKLATFFNKGWLEFTGRSMEQELGYGWASGLAPDQRDECLAGYSACFDNRRPWRAECQLRRADGEYKWMLCSGAPRFAPDGVFEGYIVSCSDTTELKRVQDASLANQKLESLGVLAGGIAHDFNNLLGSIHANAEIAEAEGADGSFANEEIQAIKAISIRASEIVRQLMIYAGHESSDSRPVDLSRLVREMLDLIGISISKSAVLKTDLAPDLPTIMGNGPQIQQVVMNLVLNASDALGEAAGVITVTTASVPGDRVRLEVSDTGTGIVREAQARIFDPFYTTKFGGRGLGLAVVLGIVRAHKGEIELASAPGQGTTFRVFWPASGASSTAYFAAAAAAAVLPVPSHRVKGTVLVVEDEDVLRLSVSKMLRKEGFTVIEAGDGSAAIDLLRDHQKEIDVILLDMTIPCMPSRSVAEEASRVRPDAKLLLTSAYSREMAGPVGEAKQVRGFIRKPFQLRDLVELLRETLSSRAQEENHHHDQE
jgi:PAS domain S-box-containing protein